MSAFTYLKPIHAYCSTVTVVLYQKNNVNTISKLVYLDLR